MPSKFIERVRQHKENLGVRVIDVPEWLDDNGEATKIYPQPITLYEMRKWYKGITNDDIGILVDLVIGKAEDVDGKKMFTLEDRQPLLRTAEFSVISRIAGDIMDHNDPDDIEKN